ncbi:MAG: hypothetical protein M1396_04545 [Chloroflexi bacterium]|nr:hypothetical protein [Chloroflexota bacterium]
MPRWKPRILGQWQDPRGITVSLDWACWYRHIQRFHPEIDQFVVVAATITTPDGVFRSAHTSIRSCFYRRGIHPKFPHLIVKVVVEMTGDRTAVVRTAYLTKNINAGEVQLWP